MRKLMNVDIPANSSAKVVLPLSYVLHGVSIEQWICIFLKSCIVPCKTRFKPIGLGVRVF
jgi:hypothetical protein